MKNIIYFNHKLLFGNQKNYTSHVIIDKRKPICVCYTTILNKSNFELTILNFTSHKC
jgi:hypothetical protein